MRAAIGVSGGGAFSIDDVALREPWTGEVRVRLEPSAICITDFIALTGYSMVPDPFIAGRADVGIVEEAGATHARLRAGIL